MNFSLEGIRQSFKGPRWLNAGLAVCLLLIILYSLIQLQFDSSFVFGATLALVLTALSIVFSSTLRIEKLSTAHMIGMFAFLVSPAEALPLLTLCVLAGGGIGFVVQQLMMPHHLQHQSGTRTLFVLARITISFWLSSVVYVVAGLPLPIQSTSTRTLSFLAWLNLYAVVYAGTYFVIFALQLLALYPQQARQTLRDDFLRILTIIILPIPFTIIGAEVFTLVSTASQLTLMLGLAMIIFAMYALTRSEAHVRERFSDLQTITSVMEVMRGQLDLHQIMETTFQQISNIIPIHYLLIGLRDVDSDQLQISRVEANQIVRHVLPDEVSKCLLAQVIATGGLLAHDSSGSIHSFDDPSLLNGRSVTRYDWFSFPLITHDKVIGAVAVPIETQNFRSLTTGNLHLMKIIATSSSVAIRNAQLYQHQSDRAGQLVTLNRIGSLLSGTLSPELVLDTVISSASVISQANAFAVHLFLNDSAQGLMTKRTAGFQIDEEDAIPPVIMSLERDLIEFNPGQTEFVGNKPVVISDIYADERTAPLVEMLEKQDTASMVEMPLEIGNKALGVIVFYYSQPRSFSADEIEVLRTFSTQAAQAINNAQMYTTTDEAFQRSIEQLLTLANIGRVLTSSIDVEKICELVLSNLIVVTRVHAGVVILNDFKTGAPRIMAQVGYATPIAEVGKLMEHGILRHVENSGAPWRVEDAAQETDYFSLLDESASQLAAPIILNDETRGLILVESTQPRAFTEEDVYFVTQVANQAVIAIENARLFSDIIEGRDRLQVLLDAMEEGIILVDSNGVVAQANPRIDLIGLTPQQVIGRSLQSLLRDPELRFVEAAGFESTDMGLRFAEMLYEEDQHLPINYILRQENVLSYIRRQVIPIYDQNRAVMGQLLVFYNKTQEEELAKTREDMSRMIVHDLRSPLTAVTTSLKLLQDYVPKDAEFYQLVQTLTDTSSRAIRKLLVRVDSILDVAKMQSGQMALEREIVDLSWLTSSVRQELEPLAKEISVQIKVEIPETLPPLNIDADKVERVILNLVDNALKYTPSNSSVVVRATETESDKVPNGHVRIEVLDRGPGIPDDYKDHLFDQFVQVDGRKKVRRGVGLGLTFCRLVVEAHDGRIWIEDREGGGSAFVFTMPAIQIESSTSADANGHDQISGS